MLYLFAQSIVPTVPASFLTFGSEPLYRAYEAFTRPFGISALTGSRTGSDRGHTPIASAAAAAKPTAIGHRRRWTSGPLDSWGHETTGPSDDRPTNDRHAQRLPAD